MTLAQIKTERAALNARWELCYGSASDEERAVKARLAELVDLEAVALKGARKSYRIARGNLDHGHS
ncbi:MAG TPA: hypothetical protein VD931_03705 [Baekduia sp.]|nr:hypothetical protein [Baekduia sp.]